MESYMMYPKTVVLASIIPEDKWEEDWSHHHLILRTSPLLTILFVLGVPKPSPLYFTFPRKPCTLFPSVWRNEWYLAAYDLGINLISSPTDSLPFSRESQQTSPSQVTGVSSSEVLLKSRKRVSHNLCPPQAVRVPFPLVSWDNCYHPSTSQCPHCINILVAVIFFTRMYFPWILNTYFFLWSFERKQIKTYKLKLLFNHRHKYPHTSSFYL